MYFDNIIGGNAWLVSDPFRPGVSAAAAAIRELRPADAEDRTVQRVVISQILVGREEGSDAVSVRPSAWGSGSGSTAVTAAINRALAAKGAPIVPLIAETGGINAMIVDATALLEQVTDDVLTSAFRSAGQRCSSLRLLCVQSDIAENALAMIAGAARELSVGDPRAIATHVGPVIDREAQTRLNDRIAAMDRNGAVRFRWVHFHALPPRDTYVPSTIIELGRASDLKEEVFGPVVHVVRWRATTLPVC
jgi:RHH-type transcriptional regulator, proline utilization regulon repressor / proline dehydrogenase / delta 1-pyrroline-5-carboxylate dehydrogenase